MAVLQVRWRLPWSSAGGERDGGREGASQGLRTHPGLFELVLASPGCVKTGDEELPKVRG